MPQYVTLSLSAKFEKGPDLKSEAKIEVGSYAGLIDEPICKCSESAFELPTISGEKIEMLIISADKYKSEKDCQMTAMGAAVAPDPKHVYFTLYMNDAAIPGFDNIALIRPTMLSGIPGSSLTKVKFSNKLTEDVKVSLLAVMKKN